MDSVGLYVHIPFCERKCNYCDFNSYSGKTHMADEYFDRLTAEMKSYASHTVDTVYFGGGTPSSVDSRFISSFLDNARNHFNITDNAEITIEVNPASVTADKLNDYIKSGINRISMGAQSFVDDELKILGRLHNSDDIYDTYNLIRSCGFDNVSLDLMFGLPGQSMKSLEYSIDCILKLHPEHISCYALKIEEGTPFYAMETKGEITLPDEDIFADMYELICEKLTNSGYIRYEISNFCLLHKYSGHNSRYWQCKEYMGLGAGASSYVNGVRSRNTDDILAYTNIVEETLSENDMMSEYVVFGLRMTDKGISISEFKNRFGKEIYDVFGIQLEKHKDFITRDGDVLKLKKEVCYVSNAVLVDFML